MPNFRLPGFNLEGCHWSLHDFPTEITLPLDDTELVLFAKWFCDANDAYKGVVAGAGSWFYFRHRPSRFFLFTKNHRLLIFSTYPQTPFYALGTGQASNPGQW